MNLRRHLAQSGQSAEQFGLRIGVSAVSVRRYMSGDRIPSREVMARIVEATHGAVQPNDFYSLDPDAELAEEDREPALA